ncbi:Ig-like domain-containing protein [Pseudomonas citronellolis]|uniref:Ig-like domain-containing protein n=1 Tax=Pseudomonas citronellolis TaxID=53408 RepID=UPI0023E361AD|nr:Ig-like domain-containing protein [Pseudomonas citronellolis]MDF3936706.1 Ig-like domain-containing protein [Pseudomonas citronellolis]
MSGMKPNNDRDIVQAAALSAMDAAQSTGAAASSLSQAAFGAAAGVRAAPPVPSLGQVADDVGDKQKPLSSGDYTDDQTPTFSGSGVVGTQIRIYDNGTLIGSVKVKANGTWSFSPTTRLIEGDHNITFTAINSANEESAHSAPFLVHVDMTPPNAVIDPANGNSFSVIDQVGAVTGPISDGGVTDDRRPQFIGKGAHLAGPGDAVLVNIYLDGASEPWGSAVVNADGSWTFTPPSDLADGHHEFVLKSVDAAGYESLPSSIAFTVDTTPPPTPSVEPGFLQVTDDVGPVTGLIAKGASTDDNQPTLDGKVQSDSDAKWVNIYDGDTLLGSAAVNADKTWHFQIGQALADGEHVLYISGVDAAGNESAKGDGFEFSVDTQILPPPPVGEGDLQIIDDVAPIIGPIAKGGVTNDNLPTLEGKLQSDSDAKWVKVYDGDTLLGSAAVNADKTWTFQVNQPLADGAHDFSFTAVSASGRESAHSDDWNFTVDTLLPPTPSLDVGDFEVIDDVAPVIGAIAKGDTTNDNLPTLEGTLQSDSDAKWVKVYDGQTLLGSAAVNADKTWSFQVNQPLADGEHVLHVSGVDAAGNESAPGEGWNFTVDTLAPPPPPLDAGDFEVIDDVAPVTGPIAKGGVTNDNLPTLDGQLQAGSDAKWVNIYDGQALLGSAAVNADGTWSFQVSQPLADGEHVLYVSGVDAAGNESAKGDGWNFSVDTVAPPTPQPDAQVDLLDDVGPVTGTIAKGGVTDDARPTFLGQLPAGSDGVLVRIYDGNSLIGSAVVSALAWRFEPSPDLQPGNHSFSYAVVDAAGNESDRSAPWDFRLIDDGVVIPAPSIDQVLDDIGSITGALHDGDSTDDKSPSLTGQAEPGSVVVLFVDGQAVASAQVDAQGNWQAELPLGSDGDKSIVARVRDEAGRLGEPSPELHLTLDTAAPAKPSGVTATDDVGPLTGSIQPGSITDDTTPTIAGKGEPGGVATIKDGDQVLGTALVDANGNWSFTPEQPLADGEHSITATVADKAGNTSQPSDPLEFGVQGEPPVVAITAALDQVGSITGEIANGGATNDNRPVLIGTASANAVVVVKEGPVVYGSAVADADGNWSLQLPLRQSDGEHLYTAEVKNAAGNGASAQFELTVDTVAPGRPSIDEVRDDVGAIRGNVAANGVTDDAQPTLEGTSSEPNVLIKVYDNGVLIGSVQADADGFWSLQLPELADGAHSLSVSATDDVGNESLRSRGYVINVDTAGPQALIDKLELIDDVGPLTGPVAQGGLTDDTQPTLRGHVSGGDAPFVEIFDGETSLGTALVDARGNWSFTPEQPLAEGEHSLQARPLDRAGNPGEMSQALDFGVVGDGTPLPSAPTIDQALDDQGAVTGPLANGDSTDDKSLSLSGQADPGSTVVLYVDGQPVASASVDAQGNWQAEVPLSGDGDKVITAKAEDAAGRPGDASEPLQVTLDTQAPAKPAGVTATDDVGDVTGPIQPGSVTDDRQPVFSGKGEPGDVATLKDGDEVLGTAVVDANGNWTLTPETPLEDGPHSISVTLTDPAGNTSQASDPLQFGVSDALPEVTIRAALDQVGSITGEVLDQGVTDDRRPTLLGTATPNAVVVIKEGPVVYGSAVADAEGNWSLRLPLGQSDGEHTYTAEVKNAAGESASAEFSLTVDTVAPYRPDIEAVLDDVGLVTGPLKQNAVTDDSQPTLQGGGEEPGELIKVYDNGQLLGSTLVDDNGEWAFTPEQPLADGAHKLTVTASDEAGNESRPSGAFNLTVQSGGDVGVIDSLELLDDVGPRTGAIHSGDVTDDTQPTLRGHVAGGNASLVQVFDGETLLGSASVDAQGNWSFTSPLLNSGEHSFSARPVSEVGTPGAQSDAIDFSVLGGDVPLPQAPSITEVLDDQGAYQGPLASGDSTDDESLSLRGQGEPNGTVVLYVNGQPVASVSVDAQGNWQAELPLAGDGEKVITAKSEDAAGRLSGPSPAIDLVLDTQAPAQPEAVEALDNVGPVTGPIGAGASTDDTTPTFAGKGEPGDVATIKDGDKVLGSAVVDDAGNWSFTPEQPLEEGEHSVSVVLTDKAGNSSEPSAPLDFAVELVPPSVSIDALSDDVGSITGAIAQGGVSDDARPTLSGQAGNGATLVKVYADGVLLGSAAVAADGSWSFTPAQPLADGEHALQAVAQNAAGSQSAPAEWQFSVDTVAPDSAGDLQLIDDVGAVTGPIEQGGLTDDNRPTFSGVAAGADQVKVYDGGQLLGTAAVAADGSWSFTPQTPLADGQHALTAVAVDAAGNAAPASPAWSFGVDTTPPPAVVVDGLYDDAGKQTGDVPNGGITDDSKPAFYGHVASDDSVLVYVYDKGMFWGSTTVDKESGEWSFSPMLPLDSGQHSFQAAAVDAAGNVGPLSPAWDFKLDGPKPQVPAITNVRDDVGPDQGYLQKEDETDDYTPTLTGTCAAGTLVTIYANGEAVGSQIVAPDGNWTITTADLRPYMQADGLVELVAGAVDSAGQPSPSTGVFPIYLDTGAQPFGAEASQALAANQPPQPEVKSLALADNSPTGQGDSHAQPAGEAHAAQHPLLGGLAQAEGAGVPAVQEPLNLGGLLQAAPAAPAKAEVAAIDSGALAPLPSPQPDLLALQQLHQQHLG